ncbi:sigma-70 family RNA polymerase sigma factor [Trujillonella endophytica]|uniref:RNA polymerase sigma-70 factor, ECF subfamily n=1 Tax=Trujillonella endophytica TaxID=673521 RepID=A0A1H8RK79_9ACTN|nr:sigma-70 family RNA polymerase sigma factor [Trujillella endophytica]SEO66732.1 RNA polymerase sigma-70 factor, ECF subfamily [Trujillella endophytica]
MTEDAARADLLLAERFEAHRRHLRAVAQRLLGSADEADDAVQEAWLRLQRTGAAGVDNLGAWLTAVVGRICLDELRRRAARREESLEARGSDPGGGREPEAEAVLVDAVGGALLVVLDTLAPPERLAFVLHDLFAVPFDEVAVVLDRTPAAARQLASRARRRVRDAAPGATAVADAGRRREVVQAFLAAARGGDLTRLLAVLDPDVVVRADAPVAALGGVDRLDGRDAVARAFLGEAHAARAALVDGVPGAVVVSAGRVRAALEFTVSGGRVIAVEVVSDPVAVVALDVVLLEH